MREHDVNPISPKLKFSTEASAPAAAEGIEEEVVDDEVDESGDEGRVPRERRAPNEPTNNEIRLHEITHTPYRSWCPVCVKSRGRGYPHKNMEQRRDGKPVIVMDYKTFTIEGAEKRADSEDVEAQTKAIVMRHQGAGMLVGHMVERKGDKDQLVVQRWWMTWLAGDVQM